MSVNAPIRDCDERDVPAILAVVNEAAERYRGVIPADVWHVPYMPEDELRAELAAGVRFVAYDDGAIQGVMGLQDVADVSLIRHAYTRTALQGRGIGGALLAHLRARSERPMLIGTWRAADWAVRFYEHHGFHLVPDPEIPALLRRYWTVPERQIAQSVVLADDRFARATHG
jgi:GNAT superfamily N-acetyltransferase